MPILVGATCILFRLPVGGRKIRRRIQKNEAPNCLVTLPLVLHRYQHYIPCPTHQLPYLMTGQSFLAALGTINDVRIAHLAWKIVCSSQTAGALHPACSWSPLQARWPSAHRLRGGKRRNADSAGDMHVRATARVQALLSDLNHGIYKWRGAS